MGENMNRWIFCIVTFVSFLDYIQTQNLKPYSELNLLIDVNFLIIHVVIDFNRNHHKKIG
jgi:hypothetical protein